MPNRCLLVDIAGLELTPEDREILQHPLVAGIILFSENYASPAQLQALTQSIRAATQQPLLIAVDQEGGRVQRFVDGFTRLPAMQHWGQEYAKNPAQAKQHLHQAVTTMAQELMACGVNASLAPVLDIDYGINDIIGERSFNRDPQIVVELAAVACDAMHAVGMPTIGKHFPGHGGVVADSHVALPQDERSISELMQNDVLPFQRLLDKLDAIMPAHVVYSELDQQPAGFSRAWLQDVLRQQLGFNGVVMSDDLSMAGAASIGSYVDRAYAALEAGCDMLCICHNRVEVTRLLDELQRYDNVASQQRLLQYLHKLS